MVALLINLNFSAEGRLKILRRKMKWTPQSRFVAQYLIGLSMFKVVWPFPASLHIFAVVVRLL